LTFDTRTASEAETVMTPPLTEVYSPRVPRRTRAGQRGLTLIELSIGVLIGVFLTAAAVAFATHETRLMGVSQDQLDLSQSGRAALDLLARDLSSAGAGVGYGLNGAAAGFAGLLQGPFQVDGVSFNTTGAAPTAGTSLSLSGIGPDGREGARISVSTVDLGILSAQGTYATIAAYDAAGSGQLCEGPPGRRTQFRAGELVVLRDAARMAARTARITAGAAGACTQDTCVFQCIPFTFVDAPGWFATDPQADQVNYLGGEIAGGLAAAVWFITDDGAGRGTLRRAVFDANNGCAARDAACGTMVADLAETLQAVAYSWNATDGRWVNSDQQPIRARDRIRVDLELVVRGRGASGRPSAPIPLMLRPGVCVPDCGTTDGAVRRVYRTSVELKNSGV
jgi:hypothetical protein